jgi:nicotinamidase-related amidase
MGSMPLDRSRAVVLIVDVQEAFRSSIDGFDRMARSIATLAQGAGALGLPVIVTEQNPEKLGTTVPEIAAHLDAATPLSKMALSSAAAEGFDLGGRDQVLLCGIETHVCVYQTAADLLARQVEVELVVDAVASRSPANREVAITRMESMGVAPTTVEMCLFELLGRAGTPEFKQIQRLVV